MSNSNKGWQPNETAWSALAGVLLLAAAVCWWRRLNDAAFVISALGLVAWFWRQRNRYRAIRIEAEQSLDREKIDDEQAE